MKSVLFFILLITLAPFGFARPFWDWTPFSSSKSNAEIANKNYQNSWLERQVAKNFGDEIPNMRDDLVKRKNAGEGIITRHFNSWRNLDNWSVDTNHDQKERDDPYYGS